jgi:hypothetical protein
MSDKSIISPILSTDVPDILYHYTNSSGLRGILASKQIWVSKIHYLNDKMELQLAFDYIRDELDQQRKEVKTNQADEELNNKYDVLGSIDLVNISVASFTEEGDQLSQWRGYCEIGDGYSLGFNGRSLLNQAKKADYHLVPCVYEEQIHRLVVKELVSSTRVANIRGNPKYDKTPFYRMSFADAVLFIAPIIKSESFKEEKEWRLISRPLGYEIAEYRQGAQSLIPYWKFNINLVETLKSIIIGPTAEPDLSLGAVHGLLYKEFQPTERDVVYEITKNIKHSKIPYRKV